MNGKLASAAHLKHAPQQLLQFVCVVAQQRRLELRVLLQLLELGGVLPQRSLESGRISGGAIGVERVGVHGQPWCFDGSPMSVRLPADRETRQRSLYLGPLKCVKSTHCCESEPTAGGAPRQRTVASQSSM